MSPKVAASCRLSGLVMYFCSWKRFSRPLRCRLENTALDQDLFLLLDPPAAAAEPEDWAALMVGATEGEPPEGFAACIRSGLAYTEKITLHARVLLIACH